MAEEFHSAHANVAFDHLIRTVEAKLGASRRAALGFGGETVEQRVVQQIVELAFNPFVEQCARRAAAGEPPLPPPGKAFDCGGLRFDPASGAVRPGLRLMARALGQFFGYWALVFWRLIASASASSARNDTPCTILLGVGAESLDYEGTDARFVAYCRKGPVEPLAAATRLMVQSAKAPRSSAPEFAEYARFPLLALLHGASSGAAERFQLIGRHLFLPLRLIAQIIRRPLLCLIARDVASIPLVDWLSRRGLLEAVVLTNSAASRQELWLRETHRRSFRAHMVWYSQNTVPLVFVSNGMASDYPGYRHIRVDAHWVWTADYAVYLRQLDVPGEIRAVGPILWYLPEPAAATAPDEIRVAIFDVTPVRDEVAPRIGIIGNYYRTENMIRFLEDLVVFRRELGLRTGKRVRLMLKHKRSYHPIHDPRYLELIERLSGPEGPVELVPFQANMYALLAGSDLCVVVPYSSPAYVASPMGRPAVFFDVSSEIVPTHLPADHVSFASGRDELLAQALAVLGYQDAAQPAHVDSR